MAHAASRSRLFCNPNFRVSARFTAQLRPSDEDGLWYEFKVKLLRWTMPTSICLPNCTGRVITVLRMKCSRRRTACFDCKLFVLGLYVDEAGAVIGQEH